MAGTTKVYIVKLLHAAIHTSQKNSSNTNLVGGKIKIYAIFLTHILLMGAIHNQLHLNILLGHFAKNKNYGNTKAFPSNCFANEWLKKYIIVNRSLSTFVPVKIKLRQIKVTVKWDKNNIILFIRQNTIFFGYK